MTNKITEQVREALDDRTSQLRESGRKVVRRVLETVDSTKAKGLRTLAQFFGELSPKDLIDRFGGLTFPEIVEMLRRSEVAKDADVLRREIISVLGLVDAEQLADLKAAIDQLNKRVESLEALKTEVKKLRQGRGTTRETSRSSKKTS